MGMNAPMTIRRPAPRPAGDRAMPAMPPMTPRGPAPQAPMGDETPGMPQSRYPDANEIPEVQMDNMRQSGEAEGMQNPILPALETVMAFVVGEEAKGNPAAKEMKTNLESLLKSMLKNQPGAEALAATRGQNPAMAAKAGAPGGPEGKPTISPAPESQEGAVGELDGEQVRMGSPFSPPEEQKPQTKATQGKKTRVSDKNQSRIQPMG